MRRMLSSKLAKLLVLPLAFSGIVVAGVATSTTAQAATFSQRDSYACKDKVIRLYSANTRCVAFAQFLLNYKRRSYNYRWGYLTVDGRYGPRTESAVVAFQRTANSLYYARLATDGVVGPKTWGFLMGCTPWEPVASWRTTSFTSPSGTTDRLQLTGC